MMIKKLAFAAHQHLQSRTQTSFKRAHLYELLSALFGFRSYASLTASAVFASGDCDFELVPIEPETLRHRYLSLGYPPARAERAVSGLVDFATEHRLGVIRLAHLVEELRHGFHDWNDFDQSGLLPFLLEGLLRSSGRGSAMAHYALALLHDLGEDDEQPLGVSYWHTQEQNGRELVGVEKEWADAYADRLARKEKYAFHLRAAAQLGSAQALLDLADRFDDPSFFKNHHDDFDEDPMRVAEIAKRLGRNSEAHRWLAIAGEEGNTDAMLELIEKFEYSDRERCWTWIYLARLLGEDFTQSAYELINEDGSPYDDDVGGSAFPIGRDALVVPPLDDVRDAAARNAAERMFSRIQQTR